MTYVLCFWSILVNRTGEATWRLATLYNHLYSDQRRTCVLSQANLWSRGCLCARHFISCSFLFGLLASEKMTRGDKIRAIKRLNFGRATAMKSNVFFFCFFFLAGINQGSCYRINHFPDDNDYDTDSSEYLLRECWPSSPAF